MTGSQRGPLPVDLAGKVALVTGAARGQGAAEAELLVAAGATVVLADVDPAGKDTAAGLGARAEFVELDVSDESSWRIVVADVHERHGRLDVLVNNAGVYRKKPLLELERADLAGLFDINLLGPILGMTACAPLMGAGGGGAIVNIASISGVRGHAGALTYAASKWGLRGASRSAARELAPLGIRVNCVCPGSVDTPMIDAANLDLSHLPIPRAASATEIAQLVIYLASDLAGYVTGSDFVIDGGATA